VGNDSPTLMQTPPPPAPSSSTLHTIDSTSTMLPSPETVLHTAEIEQSRQMAITGVVFNLFGVLVAPLFGGIPLSKHIAMASLAAAAINNAWLWWAASSPQRYTQNKVITYFVVASVLNAGVIYYLGPNVEHPRWRFISLGAVFAVLVWLIASGLFAFYASRFGSYNKAWGSLSAVVVMLTWLWISSVALLLGAEINSEAERSRELRRGEPAERELQAPAKA